MAGARLSPILDFDLTAGGAFDNANLLRAITRRKKPAFRCVESIGLREIQVRPDQAVLIERERKDQRIDTSLGVLGQQQVDAHEEQSVARHSLDTARMTADSTASLRANTILTAQLTMKAVNALRQANVGGNEFGGHTILQQPFCDDITTG